MTPPTPDLDAIEAAVATQLAAAVDAWRDFDVRDATRDRGLTLAVLSALGPVRITRWLIDNGHAEVAGWRRPCYGVLSGYGFHGVPCDTPGLDCDGSTCTPVYRLPDTEGDAS